MSGSYNITFNDVNISGIENTAITPTGTTTARTLVALFADMISVKDFGAIGDNKADDTAAINAALATNRGVYFPAGFYKITSAITVNSASIIGEDMRVVGINIAFATGDAIVLSGDHPRIAGLSISATVARAAGATAVHVSGAFGAVVEDIIFNGPHGGDGILLDATNTTHLRHLDFRPPVGTGYGAYSAIHVINNGIDVHMDAINISNWTKGIELTYTSGIFASKIDIVQCNNGLVFNPSTGQDVFSVFMFSVLADSSVGDGIWFTGLGSISDIAFVGCWPSSSPSNNGVLIDAAELNGITFTGCHIINNAKNGVFLNQGKNIGFVNCQITDNSMSGSASYDGITIGGSVDQVRVIGCFIGSGGSESVPQPGGSGTNKQRYGINANSTATGDTRTLTVAANQLPLNVTSALNMPTGAGIVQNNNTDQGDIIAGTYGAASFTDLSTSAKDSYTFSAQVDTNGVNIKLVGIAGGGTTTPSKTIRVVNGHFNIINDAYTNTLLDMDDDGNVTLLTSSTLAVGTVSAGAASFTGAVNFTNPDTSS